MICFLIEDDADDREIFLTALNALDKSIELVAVKSGVLALEKINEDISFLPDYIFLDLNMPYMSGRECLTKLKEIERIKNVPIILYSTIQEFEDLATRGATGFITKPNSIAELTKVLSGIIKQDVK